MRTASTRTPAVSADVVVEPEMLTACPLCGSRRLTPWRRDYDRSHLITGQTFSYARCLDCDLRFESERPPESEIWRFYPGSYYEPRSPDQQPLSPSEGRARLSRSRPPRLLRFLARLDAAVEHRLPDPLPERIRSAYTPPRKGSVLLDYGCGSPAFLDAARDRGWDTIGVDLSPRVVAEVGEHGHRALSADPSAWDAIPDGSVALVRMNHVVEHVYRPRETLGALRRKLEAGGTLHVSTPNPRSVASVLLGRRWLGLDCPRHVLLYPAPLLAALLRELGFRRVDVFHEVLTKDVARSLGHLLHDLGRLRHEEILSMADRPALVAVLDLPVRLAARFGRSDRFHCFAEA